MAQRVFFLNTLHPHADPAEYEAWIRRVDYPIARAQAVIRSYEVTRLEGTLSGEGEPSVQYLETIEIADLDEYRSLAGRPEFAQLLAEWAGFVAKAEAVHGTVIE